MQTRRDFLKLGGGIAAGSVLAACQTPEAPERDAKDKPVPTEPNAFNFDRPVNRIGTDSVKWDGRSAVFGTQDVVPLWVADMDFAAPAAVQQALQARAAHPVYGYTQAPERMFTAVQQWQQQRHGWDIERDALQAVAGVVPVLYAAVRAFTREGEGVIIQPPVYTPFFSAVTDNDRKLLLNPLREESGHFRMDFDHLEQCMRDGGKLLLLCSPHNPVGRVWQREELQTLLDLARRYDVVVVADEIHADLVYAPHKHIPLATLEDFPERVVTALAPSKTFNIPGMGLAFMVCAEPQLRAQVMAEFRRLHIEANHPFSLAAAEAAYTQGAPWLDALLVYLAQTQQAVVTYLGEHLPQIKVRPSAGTFLMWLDFRELMQAHGLDDQSLQRRLVTEAKVGMSPGTLYGQAGSGFMRLNIGAPREVILDALRRLHQVFVRS